MTRRITLWLSFARRSRGKRRTAHEYDPEGFVYFSIGLDLLCLVALIAARMQVSRARPDQPLSDLAQVMIVLAVLPGVGLLAIRLNNDASWWNGHLRYDCCPKVESVQPRSP